MPPRKLDVVLSGLSYEHREQRVGTTSIDSAWQGVGGQHEAPQQFLLRIL
jgi:hypothetical protein